MDAERKGNLEKQKSLTEVVAGINKDLNELTLAEHGLALESLHTLGKYRSTLEQTAQQEAQARAQVNRALSVDPQTVVRFQ